MGSALGEAALFTLEISDVESLGSISQEGFLALKKGWPFEMLSLHLGLLP
jgi:hypothetical protein